jgi:competence protein ComEA
MKRSKLILAALAIGFVVPVLAMADDTTPPASTPPATSSEHHEKSSTKPAKPHVNLNTGTKEQLMTIPGLDDATADKIIAARPFKSKNELVEKKIMTKKEYEKISGMVTTGSSSSHHSSSTSTTKK